MSALDARTRIVAAEVFAELAAGTQPTADAGTDRMADLEKQVATLTARVDELEKATTAASAKRTTRTKTTPESTE